MRTIGFVLASLAALSLSACGGGATGSNARNGGDPLIGNQPPLDPKARPLGDTRNPSPGTNAIGGGPLPGLAAPASSTSAAALAPGTVPQLDTTRDLRIGAGAAGGSPGAATLGKPEPVRGTPTSGAPAPAPGGPIAPLSFSATPAAINSVDQGLQYLTNRGVQGFRLELQRDTGQWRCSCAMPNSQNPSVKRTYEFTANDPLAAIRAVVERVSRDNP